jgi:hypothetical protein
MAKSTKASTAAGAVSISKAVPRARDRPHFPTHKTLRDYKLSSLDGLGIYPELVEG